LIVLGTFLLSRMNEQTSILVASLYMLVLGMGIGLVMQVLVIAVQNAVDYRHLGAATSGVTFFRSMGGSFGTAVFGAIFSNLLVLHLSLLASSLPRGYNISNAENIVAIQYLPAVVRAEFAYAYAQSLSTVFLVAAPITVVAFILTWLVPEVRLRTTTQATDVGCTFAMPAARSSQEEIERALHVLASRDSRYLIFSRLAARAGVALDPLCCWLLFRIQEQGPVSQGSLAKRLRVSGEKLTPSIVCLKNEWVTVASQADGEAGGQIQLTAAGQQTLNKLAAAYQDSLAELLEGWSPEQEAELAMLLRRVVTNLLGEDTSNELVLRSSLAIA
jgi:DNA-binding MarR family transcriptional regulator